MNNLYTKRDPMKLDEQGDFYIKHVSAMTSEKLHSKSDIACELAYRDYVISQLSKALDTISSGFGSTKAELEKYAEDALINIERL